MNLVKLSDIVEQLETLSGDTDDTHLVWLDKRNGKIYAFEREILGIVEDMDDDADLSDYPEWQREQIAEAMNFYDRWDRDSLISFPDKYEIREYGIMEEFCEIQGNPQAYNQLEQSIHGKGAFRRFRDTVDRLGMIKEWYTFRDRVMLEKAREWCEENDIDYTPKRESFSCRRAAIDDIETVTDLLARLYYKSKRKIEENRAALREENVTLLSGDSDGIFLVYDGEKAIGTAHCSVRHGYVEGTESSPVGYLEGLFVVPDYRLKGAGRKLLDECERWAVKQGCLEFASDCEIDNEESYRFHVKTGFLEVSRNIHFTKPI